MEEEFCKLRQITKPSAWLNAYGNMSIRKSEISQRKAGETTINTNQMLLSL